MRSFRSRPASRVLSAAISALVMGLAAGAAPAPVEALAEAPPVPGGALPLRPGELLVPTADGACSVVVFAPHEEGYNRLAAYWRGTTWTGACRFGLAHGEGAVAALDGKWRTETVMVYGTEINPAEAKKSEAKQDGAVSWTSVTGKLNFFSGAAFNDLEAARYVIRLERKPARDLELGDLVADWYGSDYLERHTFDEDGREEIMSVSAFNIDAYCGLGFPDEFKRFEKDMQKACKKTGERLVLIRREGLASDLWVDRPITWLKACPINKARQVSDCGPLVRSALSKEAAELEAFLTDGDAADRNAAEQEIIARYKPLEDAFAASLLINVQD